MSPRIAVLGTGANGASIAADLTRAGLDVTAIEQWPEHVEAIRANGLRVNTPDGSDVTQLDIRHLCEVATTRGKFDIVLMLVKAYDSRWAAQLIEPYLADDGLLVGVQNGMMVDVIADVVGAHRTVGCVIEITSMMFEPGIVERHSQRSRSWFAVGALDPSMGDRVDEVAALLRLVGSVDVVDDIRSAKWMKLVSNCTTLVTTAILGLPMIEAAAIPEMRQVMLASGNEALDAALASGSSILPIFGLPPEAVSVTDQVVETLLDTLLGGFVMPNSKTTVLQDWMKGRRSEVDQLNGHIVTTLAALGRDAPLNRTIVELAHRIEAGELAPSRDHLHLLTEIATASAWTADAPRNMEEAQ